MKTRSIAYSISSLGSWLLPGLGCIACGVAYGQFDRFSIVIEESGPVSDPDFLVRVVADGLAFLDPPAVIAPSGEPLDLGINAPFFSSGSWEGEVDSLGEALGFVSGDWEASYSQRSFETGEPERITRDIEVLSISEADVVRSAPTLLSPVAGGFIADGRESLFEWEYETTPVHLSYISIDAPELGLGRSGVRSTPTLFGSASGGGTSRSGDRELRIEYRDDPQATTNRWLYEIDASNQHLPVDLIIQVGGYTPLNDFLQVDGEPTTFFSGQRMSYIRLADPVAVRLLVPEPSTLVLLFLSGLVGWPRRSQNLLDA